MINQGSMSTPKVECINRRLGKWRVRYDYLEEKDEERDMTNVSFYETGFSHKPTIEEIKDYILGIENGKIDERILSGFKWKDMDIWLSSENQFNYKAAYDLAVQTDGTSLPVTFKFGTTETPVYHKFDTLEDLTDFYTSVLDYVNKTLAEGWAKKDSIDFSEYESLLNENK